VREAMDHAWAKMSGKTPQKALIIHGRMPPKKFMIDGMKYLRRLGPIRHFIRDHGKWFEGRASVKDYPKAIYWRRKHKPQPNRCFQNAREYCLAHPEARYFEGYYMITESPIDHGWIVQEDGKVLDFTHEAVIQKLKREKEKVHVAPPLYVGIEIPHEWLAELHVAVEENQPILDLYRKSLRKRHK